MQADHILSSDSPSVNGQAAVTTKLSGIERRTCLHGHDDVIRVDNGNGTLQRICLHDGCDYSVADEWAQPIECPTELGEFTVTSRWRIAEDGSFSSDGMKWIWLQRRIGSLGWVNIDIVGCGGVIDTRGQEKINSRFPADSHTFYAAWQHTAEQGGGITTEQLAILRHALGYDGSTPPKDGPFRSYYCTDDGDPELEALVALGLMRHGDTLNNGAHRYYMCTEAGRVAAEQGGKAGAK